MDYESALELAKKEDLNILMKFTTAKCRNCILLEKNVFSKDDFKAYASENLVLVWLDYSRKYKKTPEKYLARNEVLADFYGIRGYPTCVYLESNGKNVIGHLGNRGNGKEFIEKLEALEVLTPKGVGKYLKAFPDKAEAFNEALAEVESATESMEEWLKTEPKKSPINDQLYTKLSEKVENSKKALMNFVMKK